MSWKYGAKYKYLTHATKNDQSAKNICEEWLKYQEWRPNICADLVQNLHFTKTWWQRENEHTSIIWKNALHAEHREKTPDITHIIIFKKPDEKIIHYGNTSMIDEDNEKKIIKWFPRVWRWGWSELAIFDNQAKIGALIPNKEEQYDIRLRLASESKKADYKYLNKNNILLDYIPSEVYKQTLHHLSMQIQKLDKIDAHQYIQMIRDELDKSEWYKKEWIDTHDIAKELLYSTIEQQVTRLIRSFYLKTRLYLGYQIKEWESNRNSKILSDDDTVEGFLQTAKEYKDKVNKPDFDIIGDVRLNKYIRRSINNMYEEIESHNTSQSSEIRDEEVEIKPYHNIAQRKFRNDMNAYLKTIKWTDAFGLGKIKRFHIFKGSWEVGVVLKFEVEEQEWNIKTYVFKTCLWYRDEINATTIEAEAGKRRADEGASVRRSIAQWEIHLAWKKQPYVILPYAENETNLNDLNEKGRESVYYQIWENMALMHRAKWEWFGKIKEIKDNKLIWTDREIIFKEKIDGIYIKDFLIENGFFQDKDELEDMINYDNKAINDEFKNGEESTLIHNDVSSSNMFIENTKQWPKIIISDLDATLGHPMEDLWLAIVKNAYLDIQETAEKQNKIRELIMKWYREKWGKINTEVMKASLFLVLISRWVRVYNKWLEITKENHQMGEKMIERAKRIIKIAKGISWHTEF
jgi:hypothetical protein